MLISVCNISCRNLCIIVIACILQSVVGGGDDLNNDVNKKLVKVEALRYQKFHDALTVPAAIKIQQLKQRRQEDVAQGFSELMRAANMHASAVGRIQKKMEESVQAAEARK